MTPCSPPKPTPITSCSASLIVDGRRPPFAAVIERVEWWAEVFEVPCIGYADNLDEVSALKQAGSDFIALGDWLWTKEEAPAALIAAAAKCLGEAASPVVK